MDWKRTGKKLLHVLGMALLALVIMIALLAMLGTVAHASGLVDDTVDAGNLYSKYPLSNYSWTSMWIIAGRGFLGTGWTVSEKVSNTGFTVSLILSGLSACI